MTKKLVLFDCDETLWTSMDKDHISSAKSALKKLNSSTIVRLKDNKVFTLKKGVVKAFAHLSKNNNQIVLGIVSDNEPEEVISALRLFNLWKFINKEAFNVRLWKGYCPKHEMIVEILNKNHFKNLLPGDTYFIDDKDYSKEAKDIGVNFIQVTDDTDLYEILKNLK